VFLGNIRTAFIVALSLPICALVAIICMGAKGISANLMSLGGIAIAIGMLGDGAIVMVENIYRHLNDKAHADSDKSSVILTAARQVSKPIVFSIGIIIVVFLPIFTLEGVEGKMFSPMAFTISFALLGSILTALVLSPVLCLLLLKQGTHKELFFIAWLKTAYRPLLELAIRMRIFVVAGAAIVFLASMIVLKGLGTEFIPTLEEGSILIGTVMSPSISLEKATDTVMKIERQIIRDYPEVDEIISRIGRPEAGSHPHPVNYAEIHLELRPRSEWTRFDGKQELIASLSQDLADWPGVQLNFTQPIQNAFDELLSGIKAQLAIKVFGEDMDILREKAKEISAAIEDVPGLVDMAVEQSFGQPQVQVLPDRAACSRHGISVSQIQEMVELAVGGEVIDNLYLNTRRYGIHVRFKEQYRVDPAAIRNILVHTEDGSLIPMSQVAQVKEVIGPIQVNRESNQRRWIVQGNVRGRDLGGVIGDIQARIEERVELPSGYYVEYGGQFENQQRAMARLSIIVPIMIAAVFLMLWMSFDSACHAMIIIVNVPMALIGGVFGLFLMGEYLSVPASVGFIALFGIAVQNGVVLVSCINELREGGYALQKAVIEGCMLRLRPVLMTAVTTILGLLPLLLSRGIGSEVQRPLAVVVVFGLASSTLLTLFVIPAVYGWLGKGSETENGG
jgi:cobalt-zinc-cadmium resistance protein CzcA